jgi:hypothetical protein
MASLMIPTPTAASTSPEDQDAPPSSVTKQMGFRVWSLPHAMPRSGSAKSMLVMAPCAMPELPAGSTTSRICQGSPSTANSRAGTDRPLSTNLAPAIQRRSPAVA